MNILKSAAVCTGAVALLLGGAVSAQAGEYTGNGGDVPGGDKAQSICHFSGQDLPDAQEGNPPGHDDDMVTGGKVQNYGQIVRAGGKGFAPSPGVACNGHSGFLAGGGGE